MASRSLGTVSLTHAGRASREHESTQLGLCFRDAARAAGVPPFSRPRFVVTYPFRF